MIENICIYCGSNPGAKIEYTEGARRLAWAMTSRGIGLVYGGSRVGVMGEVADAALSYGGIVTGVIPRALMAKEVGHTGLTELVVTDSMHDRKAVMAERSDAFVALPGGIGTLEELLEIWTWAQLGLHHKPCALFNIHGYFDRLIEFIEHMVQQRFLRPAHRDILVVESDAENLLCRLQDYRAPEVEKWIDQEET